MTAVAIYARYSSDNQREASIEDQVRLCRERAAREGWTVASVYSDHAVSGASLIRPGIQKLMHDAQAGNFRVILVESLDRISRDQEDAAGFYKRMRFAGVEIVTLSEGAINELHVGLKGTMAALYLKDLADKTRRGLRGRIEAGKSGGGNSFGYTVVKRFDEDGAAIRGERKINEAEAQIIRRIFESYAAGQSPKAIARKLNAEKVPGPGGRPWGASAIHGHRERGTGILNNELYVGKLVWNRLRYIKDPDTGRRVSRINPASEWISREVPALRLLDQELWDRAKARQAAMLVARAPKQDKQEGMWDRRRPRTLFSGLLKCGICGGAFVKISAEHFGCAAARTKGTCDNRLTIRRDALEATVLDGLQHHLMDPALLEVFCEEYTRHINRLRTERNATRAAARTEIERIDRELDRLIRAIMDGVPGAKVKDQIGALEDRKAALRNGLDRTQDAPVLIHPEMGQRYRRQVGALCEALNTPAGRSEAADLLRGLVERITFTPAEDRGRRFLTVDLHGDLAGILALARTGQHRLAPTRPGGSAALGVRETIDLIDEIKLVAGAGFEPATFRL